MEITVDNAKEVFNYLGIDAEKLKDIAEFKTKFDTDFIKPENIKEDTPQVKAIIGKQFGLVENELKKIAKSNGVEVEFEDEEFKRLKVNEKFKMVAKKLIDLKDAKITELTNSQGNEPAEITAEWEKKMKKKEKEIEETRQLLESSKQSYQTIEGEFNNFKVESEKKIKDTKLSIVKNGIYEKAAFAPEINKYAKTGFFKEFEDEFIIDVDNEGKEFITDKKGQKIPNPKSHGAFKSPIEVLNEKLIEAKLAPLNPNAGDPKKKPFEIKQPAAQDGKKPQRTVARRLE